MLSSARPKLSLVVATALVSYVLFHTSFFASSTALLAKDNTTYEQKRSADAFRNVPIDAITEQLNGLLPLSTPIALSPELSKREFIRQRLTEALYPRILDQRSPFILGIHEGNFGITGPAIGPLTSPVRSRETLRVSWVQWLAALVGALGLGIALCSTLLRAYNWPNLWVVTAASFLGTLTMYSTMAQAPISWPLLGALGILLLAIFAAKALAAKAPLPRAWQAFLVCARHPENIVLAMLLGLFALRVSTHPIALWDGRSVWLFLTKRIFMSGMLSIADLIHPDSGWSHTNYPFLVPSWLASMGAFGELYNERTASLGIPVLFAAIVSLLWTVSRQVLGRWEGAALTSSAFFAVEYAVGGGYVDAYLMMLLTVQLLALTSERLRGVAMTAALACSLIKYEGLILSGVITLAFIALHPEVRRRPLAQHLVSLLLYVPAVSYRVFGIAMALPSDFQATPAAGIEQSVLDRLAIAAREMPALFTRDVPADYTRTQPLLWAGASAFVLATFLVALRRSNVNARIALLVAAAYGAIAVVGLASMPLDMTMLVHVTLDRVLMHPALLSITAVFLASATVQPGKLEPHAPA